MTYLFDFDGTLVDSMPTFVAAMREVMEEHGVPCDDETLRTIVPLGYRGTVEYCQKNGLSLPIDEMTQKMGARMVAAYRDTIPAKAGIPTLLRALRATGASLNILTASPHVMLDPALSRLGIAELFDHVWSCEDFGTTKSDPTIYVRAAEAMGAAVGEVWFVDDNIHALATAKAAGMRTCGVYDEASSADVDAIRAFADGYAESADALRSVLMEGTDAGV
jgi:HAD superfamily hydrolase (TIGR01509 family)